MMLNYSFPIPCSLFVAQSSIPKDKGEWVAESEHARLRVVYEQMPLVPPDMGGWKVIVNLKIWKPGTNQKIWKVYSKELMGLYKGEPKVATLFPIVLHGFEWIVFFDPVTQEVLARVSQEEQPAMV